jgi:hypothetical protein
MHCIHPIASGAKSHNKLIFICGNNTWSIRSRSRIFTYSSFPLKSHMILTRGSHDSSKIPSFGVDVQPPIALGFFFLDFLENLDGLSRGSSS